MNIETIRKRIRAGYYLTRSHAVQHAIKEGGGFAFQAATKEEIIYDNSTYSHMW